MHHLNRSIWRPVKQGSIPGLEINLEVHEVRRRRAWSFVCSTLNICWLNSSVHEMMMTFSYQYLPLFIHIEHISLDDGFPFNAAWIFPLRRTTNHWMSSGISRAAAKKRAISEMGLYCRYPCSWMMVLREKSMDHLLAWLPRDLLGWRRLKKALSLLVAL